MKNETSVVVVPQVTSAIQEYGVEDVLHQIKLVLWLSDHKKGIGNLGKNRIQFN